LSVNGEIVKIALGKKGDYSVRAVLDLGLHYGRGRRKAQEIAASMRIPRKFAPQILANLVRTGLLTATAGRDGGYELSRAPSRICLLDVVVAAEGEVELRRCVLRGIPCGKSDTCAAHEAWSTAQQAMVRQMRRTSIAEIVRRASVSPPHGSKRSKGSKRRR
jgi:Rrf2 family protein